MKLVPCMGGWCRQRDKCANYWAAPLRDREPADRLCGSDRDDPEFILRDVEGQPVELEA